MDPVKMKVYSISKWVFRAICLLILALPVGRHWVLLTTGKKATGTVHSFVLTTRKNIYGNKELVYRSEIRFEVNGLEHHAYGPLNYEYLPGRTITLFYKRSDPSRYCIATFSGFYLGNYTILPIVFLTVWAAFYMSFNHYQKRMKMPKGRTRVKAEQPSVQPSRRLPFR